MAKVKQFPKVIYGRWENAGSDDEYFQTDPDAIGLVDAFYKPVKIGVYELKEIKVAQKKLDFIVK